MAPATGESPLTGRPYFEGARITVLLAQEHGFSLPVMILKTGDGRDEEMVLEIGEAYQLARILEELVETARSGLCP
jgi:hypothetical protein